MIVKNVRGLIVAPAKLIIKPHKTKDGAHKGFFFFPQTSNADTDYEHWEETACGTQGYGLIGTRYPAPCGEWCKFVRYFRHYNSDGIHMFKILDNRSTVFYPRDIAVGDLFRPKGTALQRNSRGRTTIYLGEVHSSSGEYAFFKEYDILKNRGTIPLPEYRLIKFTLVGWKYKDDYLCVYAPTFDIALDMAEHVKYDVWSLVSAVWADTNEEVPEAHRNIPIRI